MTIIQKSVVISIPTTFTARLSYEICYLEAGTTEETQVKDPQVGPALGDEVKA